MWYKSQNCNSGRKILSSLLLQRSWPDLAVVPRAAASPSPCRRPSSSSASPPRPPSRAPVDAGQGHRGGRSRSRGHQAIGPNTGAPLWAYAASSQQRAKYLVKECRSSSDSEDFQPVAPAAKAEPITNKWAPAAKAEPLKNKWADEDVEEEEEEKPKPQPVVKAASKPSRKGAAKKGKQQASTSTEVVEDEVLDDPTKEKLRQQRLVEEADFKSTAELFAKKDGSEKSLDTFIPKSESDFAEYAELIANKLHPYEKSFHYMGLLKNVMRLSMTSLKGADAKDISSSIAAIANEKIKAEKEAAAGKKKQGAKKKQLHIEKGDDDFIPWHGGAFDDPDDYDFM